MQRKSLCLLLATAMVVAGCVHTIPKEALQLRPESLQLRQLQTRSFDTNDEKKLLNAGAGVLQDLGFTIEESETKLGVIVGSKDRDAVEAGQVAGAVMMALLFRVDMSVDKNQKIRVSLITRPTGHKTNLRVTFQRIVWNTRGQVSKTESIEDPTIYQQFFEKLSKAVFLEANQI
jgi:hypothetical protein